MSFGHAALFGTGAYVTAMLQVRLGFNPWIAACLAMVAATLVAGFIAALSFRYGLKGSYFALVTLAFAEVLRILASSFEVTGGGQGILVPYKVGLANFQFADRITTYTLVLVMVAVAMLITVAVQRSRFGAYLIAIRENEEAAKALGIDTFRTKVLAMMLVGRDRRRGRRRVSADLSLHRCTHCLWLDHVDRSTARTDHRGRGNDLGSARRNFASCIFWVKAPSIW